MSIDHIYEYVGIKTTSLVAGVFGAAASLTYERDIRPGRAVFLIFTGSVAAGYLTPLVTTWMSVSDAGANAYAFLIGLLSMRIIGGVLNVGEKFKKDPEKFINKLKGNASNGSNR